MQLGLQATLVGWEEWDTVRCLGNRRDPSAWEAGLGRSDRMASIGMIAYESLEVGCYSASWEPLWRSSIPLCECRRAVMYVIIRFSSDPLV